METYPPLLKLAQESDYRTRFEILYCEKLVPTFDGIAVRFRKSDFDHCFFESTNRDRKKDKFSQLRAERLEWIKVALGDTSADRFVGWDRDKRTCDKSRRVSLVCINYVVVIEIVQITSARFVTAYVADSPLTLQKIRQAPRWPT